MNRRPEGGYQPRPHTGPIKPPPKGLGSASDARKRAESFEYGDVDAEKAKQLTESAIHEMIAKLSKDITMAAKKGNSRTFIYVYDVSEKNKKALVLRFRDKGFRVQLVNDDFNGNRLVISWD